MRRGMERALSVTFRCWTMLALGSTASDPQCLSTTPANVPTADIKRETTEHTK